MNEIDYRPWGKFEVLLNAPDVKVKKIIIDPNKRLSYQYHDKRREQWVVVKGNLTIILDGDKVFRYPGESIHIPIGTKHRAWNETDEIVTFIEVQTGTYFGEDDIVRLEDDYMRSDDVQEFLEHVDKPGTWSEEDSKINTVGGLTNDKEGSFMKFQNKIK
tara:strand:+ start:1388 stop:1867 length:480 start_codon:yes stop_codon:yes gene_type:complete